MRVRLFGLPLVLALASGCDASADAEVVAHIGWLLDYRDWTKPLCACTELDLSACQDTSGCTWDGSRCTDDALCTTPDLRLCDNQPAKLQDAPPYPAVESVRLVVLDPDTFDPNRDVTFACADGEGAAVLPIRTLPRREREFILTATGADGELLYTTVRPLIVDLSTVIEEVFTLRAVTGDVAMDLTYPGQDIGICPADAASAEYRVFAQGETQPAVTGTFQGLCEPPDLFNVSQANKLHIRNIPSNPSGTIGPAYRILVEVYDRSGSPTYCGDTTRNITPGRSAFHDNLALTAGPCHSL